MIEDQGAKFEIRRDGERQSCRDTMLTAMGAATFSQNPKSKVAVRETGQLIVVPLTPATQQ